MKEYRKQVSVLEGPWEKATFPEGEEPTNVISVETITTFMQDGYLCERTNRRDYREVRGVSDYHDTSSHKRIIKVHG